jgi:hypothetical protein
MDAYLARIDEGMSRLGRWSSVDYVPLGIARASEDDALGRSALQALFLTGMVGDLPIQAQTHDGVQERVERAMPILDTATESMTEFLRSRGASDLAVVQTALRDHGAGARIIGQLDREAASLGLSEWRREQTRTIFANAEWRLRNQPPGLLVSEYVDKVDRIVAADVRGEAAAQELATRVAEEAFWRADAGRRRRRINRGAKVMGFGVLAFAGGAAIVAGGAFPGVFVMTVGAIMVLVGLVILLVGLGTPRAP